MADEFVDILDIEGSLTGEVSLKSIAHKEGLWHGSAQIWIITPYKKVLLQKRAANKDTYPNLWDISVAGHLSAGDSAAEGALREIKEEIGLKINESDLLFLKTIKTSKQPSNVIIDNEFNHLFLVNYPIIIEKLSLQQEEVTEVKLLSLLEFENELSRNHTDFVPHGTDYYQYIIDSIKNNLNKQTLKC